MICGCVGRSVSASGLDGEELVMRWKPVVVQSVRSDGSLVVTVGHPLVDAYLEFFRARAGRTRSGRWRSI